MVFHIYVADNVVVYDGVFSRAEIPWLLLGIVWATLETFQLVIEIEDVIGLFIAQGVVFVLSKNFYRILRLNCSNLLLSLRIGKGLSDRVILNFLCLDRLTCHLAVWFWLPLEVLLRLIVLLKVSLPG